MNNLIGAIVAFFVTIISGLLLKGRREKKKHEAQVTNVTNEAHKQRRKHHDKEVERIDSDYSDATDVPIADWVEDRLGSGQRTSSSVTREPKGSEGSDEA